MAATSTPTSPTKQQELFVQRPIMSPRKRKLSCISNEDVEPKSPTSMDEVTSSTPEESVISPKKKAKKTEELSKWESHVVASITSSLDLDCMESVELDEVSTADTLHSTLHA
ncbi:hypothetical protein BBJ29_009794 [Phytophthora kernoviae]|uniref:Uncharacterized protein n=1 Tax=Phytophthora kernoviae TaxID=325452 RepID=A0A3F2RBB9_9STRA|nr:hypothetical protein BBP00_00009882 [Phytophthora kernoviae]RLN60990.1 hypothetical protein BBJ29_009794 [Phytophthora kernoviae]